MVTFKSLTTAEVREIVELLLARISGHLKEQQITLEVSNAAKQWLAEQGFDKLYGARPLRRVLQRQVEDPLSEHLLRGLIKRGERVVVDVGEAGVTLNSVPALAPVPTGVQPSVAPSQ